MPYRAIPEALSNMPNNLAYGITPYGEIPEAIPNLTNNLAYTVPLAPTLETPYVPENAAVFNGGGFQVTSFSNVGPTGIRIQSDNLAVEGPLAVSGKLPFLGVVTIEGPLPAVGQGAVAYECGNGDVGIISEGVQNLGNGLGLSAGLAGLGCNGVGNGLPVPIGRY